MLKDLNSQQKEAILYTGGPLLVFAGAGSGKTKVIAHKFSYLVKSKRLDPDSIFAVAFTNREADEMRERIGGLLEKQLNATWTGTFHSLCNKVLRKEIKTLGYRNNFSIYDEDDQFTLLKHILRELKIHEALYRGMASRICSLKSSLIGPEEFLSSGDGFGFDEKIAKVYVKYQDELRRNNALDFDDLVMLTVKILEHNPRLLEKYQDMFSYILVDEFQETNYAQYCLLKLLAQAHKKICVVADDDQSICKSKGADLSNIVHFEKDFPGAKVIELGLNYRSTQNILNVSNAVISKNPGRKHKNILTERGTGEKVYSCWFHTCEDESSYIAKVIKELYLKGRYNYRDFAVFYRVNSQSKVIEDALRGEGLPYRVFGNTGFYQRKEIKDIIAYMRLGLNHGDNMSLRRVINCPPRGIGNTIFSRIDQEAKKKSVSLFDAIKATIRSDTFAPAMKERLMEFVKLIEALSSGKYKTAADMLRDIVAKSGYAEIMDEKRAGHVAAFAVSAEGKELSKFLDAISLSTNIDEIT
ncbi:MAG: ATP-dependent DNA helicase PcrA, partial [Nitrospira sp.]|nr:ATP-dependent DNA helicase PcrA [Nitrospira sp.]